MPKDMPHLMQKIGRAFEVDLDPHDERGRKFLLLLAATGLLSAGLVTVFSPLKAFAAVITLLVIGLAFWKPRIVLLLLAAYTPFEPFLLKFVGDDLYIYARYFSEGLIYVLLASVAVRIFLKERKMIATPIDLPFIFFLLVALTSLIVNAVPPLYGILGLRQIIRFILLFFIVVYLGPDKAYIRRMTWMMLGIVLFQGILGIAQAVVGGPLDEFLIPSERRFYESIQLTSGTSQFWSPGARVFATLGRFDQLGTFLCFFFLLGAGFLYELRDAAEKKKIRLIIALAFPALVLTLSRASWFGWVLGMLIIGAWLMKDWRVRTTFVAFVAVALMYLAWSGIAVRYLIDSPEQTVAERFFEAFSFERWRGEYYGLGRVYWMVQTPLVVVRSSPLFGVGPGQYGGGAASALGNTTVYEKLNLPFGVYGSEGYIDNNWFSLWGETGTLGLAFYAWMLVALGRLGFATWRQSRDEFTRGLALGFIAALAAVAFQSFLATYLEVRTLALYLWMYAAFVYVLARKERVIL
jgi:hypothetical protein